MTSEGRTKLKRLDIQGFRSIKSCEIVLEDVNVLIGANGAGKSNLISFVKMLNYMTTEALGIYVAESGGANSNLYYGAKITPQIETRLNFETKTGSTEYYARLFHVAPDGFAFADEQVTFAREGSSSPKPRSFGAGHKESALIEKSLAGDATAGVTRFMLSQCRVFQFHDTSATSKIRQNVELDNNRFLYADAGNLAAVLYLLQQTNAPYYNRIVATIQQVAPFFGGFAIEPLALNPRYTSLRWKERGSEYEFGPHQLSDGTLRAMALITLLLQPVERLPSMILLDEPELGLHPSAVALICALIRQASACTQIILATQSPYLLDQFEPKDVIIVERRADDGRLPSSVFRRLDALALKQWTEEFTLGELWEKNVLGGRPAR